MKSVSLVTLIAAASLLPSALAFAPPSAFLTRTENPSESLLRFPQSKLGMSDDDDVSDIRDSRY